MATLKRNLCRAAFHVFVPFISLTGPCRGSSGALIPAVSSSRLRSIPCYSDNSRIVVTELAAVPIVEKSLSPLICDSYLSLPSVPTRRNSRDTFSSDTENCTTSHSNLHLFGNHGLLGLQSPRTKCSSRYFSSSCGRNISVSSFSTHQQKYKTNVTSNTETNLPMSFMATGSEQKSSICTSTRLLKEGPASSSESSSSPENFEKQQKEMEQRTVAETESVKLGDTQREEDVITEIVTSNSSGTGLGRLTFNLWSSVKMAGYLQFHKLLLEESFDENDFLEGAKHAFAVVQELFWNGDFEAMSTMVSPRVVGAFKDIHTEMMEKEKNRGFRLEYIDTKVTSASLVDFEFSFEDDGKGHYGLQNSIPQLDDYHDDMFLVFSVQLHAEQSTKNYDNEGKLLVNSVTKAFHTIKLGRQIPKIVGFWAPVKEFKSPWVLVDIQ